MRGVEGGAAAEGGGGQRWGREGGRYCHLNHFQERVRDFFYFLYFYFNHLFV